MSAVVSAFLVLSNDNCSATDRKDQSFTLAKLLSHCDEIQGVSLIGGLGTQLGSHFENVDAIVFPDTFADLKEIDDAALMSCDNLIKMASAKLNGQDLVMGGEKKVDFSRLFVEATVPANEQFHFPAADAITNSFMQPSVNAAPIVYNAGAISAMNSGQVAGVKRVGGFRAPLPPPQVPVSAEPDVQSGSNSGDDDDEYEPDPKIRAKKQWRKQYDAAKKREAERKYNTPKFRDDDNCRENTNKRPAPTMNSGFQQQAPTNMREQPTMTNAPSSQADKRPTFGGRAPGFRPASKFVPPLLNKKNDGDQQTTPQSDNRQQRPNVDGAVKENFIVTALGADAQAPQDERLKTLDSAMIELILSEIVDHGPKVDWDDVAGLETVKKNIMEVIVWPMLRPDLFRGIRGPPKGLLLFGPPGTGKTMIGKCIASQCDATFFSISASSLLSKWFGEAEKMVRTLFAVARTRQPAVIFIDEIDSMLCKRGQDDQECSRRIKTEFLVQLDGVTCGEDDRILMIGATNLPDELDEAARRRFGKRLYVALPSINARVQIVRRLMGKMEMGACALSDEDFFEVGKRAEGYSGSDMTHLCREAALGPLRSIRDIASAKSTEIRPVILDDFISAFSSIRPSVSPKDLIELEAWNRQYGTINAND